MVVSEEDKRSYALFWVWEPLAHEHSIQTNLNEELTILIENRLLALAFVREGK